MMKSLLSLIFVGLIACSTQAEACTGIRLQAKDGNIVHGRTLEFGIKLPLSIAYIPAGENFTATTPSGNGLTYTAKYAAVGAIAYDKLQLLDGINEKGLAVGTFYFPGFAEYTPTTAENQAKSLSPVDFPNWLLTQFSSLEEVKEHLSDIVIAPVAIKGWGTSIPPFHYIVYDKQGKSLVIEPIQGQLKLYDNALGILTNSPTFDWHIINLRNFINLSPNNAGTIKLENMALAPLGQGSGMLGLPGDFTPPSRFVRAAAFVSSAIPSANSQEAVAQAFHLLNQFDIPVGAARSVEKGAVLSDYTLATVVREPSTLKYYIRTYEDQNIKTVDLNTLKKSTEAKKVRLSGSQSYTDISSELKPIKTNS